jgi:type I restriction enzyme, S subunit
MNAEQLLQHFERISEAPDALPRLRRFILDLAVRGKLLEQDPSEETAAELLKGITAEKSQLMKAGKIKREKPLPPLSESDKAFEVPNGWEWVRLGDLTMLVTSGSRDWAKHYSNDGAIFVRMGNLSKDHYRLRLDHIQRVKAPADGEGTRTRLEPGDILISITGEVGMLGLIPDGFGEAYINQHTAMVRPLAAMKGRYLAELFRSQFAQAQFNEPQRGIKNSFRLSDMTQFVVPLPPLAEQHRIVAKVDELMSLCDQLDAAKAEREKCRDSLVAASLQGLNQPAEEEENFREHARFTFNNLPRIATRSAHIKQLRQTILNLAVRGKLVKQDPTDEPASELLKRIAEEKARLGVKHAVQSLDLDEVPFQLPAGWSWSRIGEACSKTGSGSTPRGGKDVYKNTGIIFLRSQNVYDNGLRLNEVVYIDRVTHEKMRSTRVLPGDLLLNITGGSMGRCCLVSADAEEANVSQHVAIIRTAVRGTESFLHKLVLSPYFQAFVIGEQTGAGRGGLPKNRMDKIAVALPPLAEQHRIVAKVDELMAICDQLEAQITAREQDSRRFVESVLADALAPGIDLSAEAQVA